MDKDAIRLEVAKAYLASDPSIIGDHSDFAHIVLPRIDRLLAALEARGLVVVPRESDDHMRQRGADASRSTIIDTDGSKHAVSISAGSAGAVYCAMISAALGGKEGTDGA